MLGIYRFATDLAAPLLRPYLAFRRLRGKEDRLRFAERLGRAAVARGEGYLAWLHAASIGESLSMLPLIEALLAARPGLRILMTTGTVTSARLMAERLPDGAFHQYAPVDRRAYVRRFLDHWRPDIALWAESEFWPNLIAETQGRGTPMVLVNGRISPDSFAGWQRARGLIAELLEGFQLCLGQTEDDNRMLRELGAGRVACLGNLKFSAPPLPADAAELSRLQAAFDGRPRWLAASTHPGEEAMVAGVHRALEAEAPGLLTLLVPRHPTRGAAIARELMAAGFRVARRGAGEAIEPDTQIYLADTLGELGLFFRLAHIVFMGKSLVPLGGQNPLEALILECAVLHGPHMANFQLICEQMAGAGCARQVADGMALASTVGELLADPPTCAAMAAKGLAFARAEAQVVDRVLAAITGIMDEGHADT